MKDGILLLTNREDGPHTDSVYRSLKDRDCKVFRLNVDQITTGELVVQFEFSADNSTCVFSDIRESFSFKEIGSIWYRRPNAFLFPIKDRVQREAAEHELQSFLDGLWYMTHDVYWMSHPHVLERARKKLFQLELAQSLGLRVPSTIITNNPEDALTFYRRHGGMVIYKTLKQGYLDYGDHGYNVPTTLIRETHLEKLSLVRAVPCLFQEYIEKDYELRITIVGKTIFAVRIDSQDFAETIVDWRHPKYIDKLRHTVISLPDHLEKRCISLVRALQLEFGAIDIVVTKNGEPVFLEINPNGQWYWLESLTGLPISKAIADELAHQIKTERR